MTRRPGNGDRASAGGRSGGRDGYTFLADERGLSVSVGYTLNLAVAALLIGGLLVTTGGIIDDRADETVRGELEVLGERVVADATSVDRLSASRAGGGTAAVTSELPDRVSGTQYTIEVDGSGGEIRLEADRVTVAVPLPASLDATVADTTVPGGSIRVYYDDGSDELVVESA